MPDSVRPERIEYPESPRLRRVRLLARLLDQSIVLPNGYRIGIDPLLGLIPGIGDVIGATMSFYLLYEGARMGLSKRVLARMFGNVLIESAVGQIPILGDIFDAVWKANVRNLRLIELHHRPTAPERSLRKVLGTVLAAFATLMLLLVGSAVAVLWLLTRWVQSW